MNCFDDDDKLCSKYTPDSIDCINHGAYLTSFMCNDENLDNSIYFSFTRVSCESADMVMVYYLDSCYLTIGLKRKWMNKNLHFVFAGLIIIALLTLIIGIIYNYKKEYFIKLIGWNNFHKITT